MGVVAIAIHREKFWKLFCQNFIVKKCYLKKIIMFIACETKLCSPQAKFFEILGEKTRKRVFSYEILIAPLSGGNTPSGGIKGGKGGCPPKGGRFQRYGTECITNIRQNDNQTEPKRNVQMSNKCQTK